MRLMPALLLVALVPLTTRAEAPATQPAAAPRIVNIINFIRGVEPREPMDLLEPVRQQIRLVHQHNLPATFLVQDDALRDERFVKLLREELTDRDEVGAWLEVVQPQVEAAGLKWRGRFPWDWHTDVGFTIGYTPDERRKLIDVLMHDFQKAFGRTPRSVGCWLLDAPTLNYLAERYGVTGACVCKDQTGTDGYTLWGGYWNQAYYPARTNAFMPAQSAAAQIDLPIFRMLGSDPIYQYDLGLGEGAQGVVSLEPVYTGKSGGGGVPAWVNWFFETTFTTPCLAFAYTQVGQENSFGWPAMSKGLTQQVELLAQWQREGKLRVETLGDSASWYRRTFPLTPTTAVVATEDWKNEGRRSVWYQSRYYRVNLYRDADGFRIRDLHLFDERYAERYLTERVTSHACTYDTLPVIDGFNWSTREHKAGLRFVERLDSGRYRPLPETDFAVAAQGNDSLVADITRQGVVIARMSIEPKTIRITAIPAGTPVWELSLSWAPEKKTAFRDVIPTPESFGKGEARPPTCLDFEHEGFAYRVPVSGMATPRLPERSAIRLRPGSEFSTTLHLTNGR